MGPIVSTPDPGSFDHPRQNGHRADLLVEDLHPHHVQDHELTAELEALLDAGWLFSRAEESLLPGFELLTHADLASVLTSDDELDDEPDHSCPPWCLAAESDLHPDGDDANLPEHRGVSHSIHLSLGGASFGDHDPNATAAVWLEQDHQRRVPRIVLELTIEGIAHEAYLNAAEARALRSVIARLENDGQR